jgi:hypothetical protein
VKAVREKGEIRMESHWNPIGTPGLASKKRTVEAGHLLSC